MQPDPDDPTINTTPDNMWGGMICGTCKLDTMFKVRERFQNEDLQHYMDYCVMEAAKAHNLLSPLCGAKICGLKIPISANGIGFSGRKLTKEENEEIGRKLKRKD